MPDILLHLLPSASAITATVLYGVLGFAYWQQIFGKNTPQNPPQSSWRFSLQIVALICHAASLALNMFGTGAMQFSFSLALSLTLWLASGIYLLEGLAAKVSALQPIVLPIAAIGALLPVMFPHSHVIAHVSTFGFSLHFLTAMLAYGLFTLSAFHAILMSFLEKKLHQKVEHTRMGQFPPLLTMEALLFRIIGIAFVLLTITLISGLFFSEEIFGKAVAFDHKTVFAIASWLIYSALLIGRKRYGWRGKVAVRWTLIGFAMLFLAYIGTNFVLEVILGRI